MRVAAAGEALIAPRITRRLIGDFARASRPASDGVPPALEELTAREIEVLRLVAQGLSNAEIATELVLGENTIKTHVGRLLAKLGLRDRVQAVVLAYETGLVTPTSRSERARPCARGDARRLRHRRGEAKSRHRHPGRSSSSARGKSGR